MSRYSSYGRLDNPILEDQDYGFLGYNSRLRPDQLPAGILSLSENGRMANNGQWQVRRGVEVCVAPFTVNAQVPTLQSSGVRLSVAVTAASRSSNTVVLTVTSGHGYSVSDNIQVTGITGYGDASGDPNGYFTITAVTTDSISYTKNGDDGTFTAASDTAFAGEFYLGNQATEIHGMGLFNNPVENGESYLIVATNSEARAFKVSDLYEGNGVKNISQSGLTISYPAGESITESCKIIQALDRVFIFRGDGTRPIEWLFWDSSDGFSSGSSKFQLVPNNTAIFDRSPRQCSEYHIANGRCVVTFPSRVFFRVDENIKVTANDGSPDFAANDEFIVQEVIDPEQTKVVFYMAESTNNTVSAVTATRPHFTNVNSYKYGDIRQMPAAPWAVYHQRRMVVPAWQLPDGSGGYTSQQNRDEILFSDILSPHTYDQLHGHFRMNAGRPDYLVGALNFSDDKLVVFNRNSIHVILGKGALRDYKNELLTGEIGCVARETITQIGNQILFLSDNGLYAVNFIDLYNLRQRDVPLSDAISTEFSLINQEYAYLSQGVYHDNRYYLAVPFGADASKLNSIFIYNFLNKEWESRDQIKDSAGQIFEFDHIVVAGDTTQRGVYLINETGGIHRIESPSTLANNGEDILIKQIGSTSREFVSIAGNLTTRGFTLKTAERKRWSNMEIHCKSGDSSDIGGFLLAKFENSDKEFSLPTLGDLYAKANDEGARDIPTGEDAIFRTRLGNHRAHNVRISFTSEKGRPIVRLVQVAGQITNRNISPLV